MTNTTTTTNNNDNNDRIYSKRSIKQQGQKATEGETTVTPAPYYQVLIDGKLEVETTQEFYNKILQAIADAPDCNTAIIAATDLLDANSSDTLLAACGIPDDE